MCIVREHSTKHKWDFLKQKDVFLCHSSFLSFTRQENDGFLFGEREEKKISYVCKFKPNVELFTQ